MTPPSASRSAAQLGAPSRAEAEEETRRLRAYDGGMRLLTLCVALTLTGPSGVARADAVGDPPDDCPPGSRGRTSHYGTYCGYLACADASDCYESQRCVVVAFCEHAEPYWASFSRDVAPHDRVRYVVDGTCDDPCPRGAACVAIGRCVDADFEQPPIPEHALGERPAPPPHPPPPARSGCGRCATQPTGDARLGAGPLVAMLFALLRWRPRAGRASGRTPSAS